MRNNLLLRSSILLLSLILTSGRPCRGTPLDQKPWDQILRKYLTENYLFNYKQLLKEKKDQARLTEFTESLNGVTDEAFKKWTTNEQKAFLINAYNAFTVQLVIRHMDKNPQMTSIKDAGGFFSTPWNQEWDFIRLFSGKVRTLDSIEHNTLRRNYPDYRIHAAVNCASRSCPVLRRQAYLGSDLDRQLDEQMSVWLKDPDRNRFNTKKRTAEISMIFKWYKDDFVADGGLTKVFQNYGPEQAKNLIKSNFDTEYLDYDWNLNQP